MPRKKLADDEVVKQEFMRRFSAWDIPVEQLQVSLDRLTNEQRQGHYLDLKEILDKPAFKRELDDWKRRVAKTLAMGVNPSAKTDLTELEKQGLRIMMLEIDNFESMLRSRANLVSPVRALRPLADRV